MKAQMTREVLIVAFALLCVSQIDGQNGYKGTPFLITRVERNQGVATKDAGEVPDTVIVNIK